MWTVQIYHMFISFQWGCLDHPPGLGVLWGLWPLVRSPGSTVWLWSRRTRTPAVLWPEDGTWWSKSFLCGLRRVTALINQLLFTFLLLIYCSILCALWDNNTVISGFRHTFQDHLRLGHRLLQPSLWYLPHSDLCIIAGLGYRDSRITWLIQHLNARLYSVHALTYPQPAGVCQKGPRRGRPRWQSSGWWAGTCLEACRAESAEGRRVNAQVSVSRTDNKIVFIYFKAALCSFSKVKL